MKIAGLNVFVKLLLVLVLCFLVGIQLSTYSIGTFSQLTLADTSIDVDVALALVAVPASKDGSPKPKPKPTPKEDKNKTNNQNAKQLSTADPFHGLNAPWKVPEISAIDRIYFTNLDSNPQRRSFMESWLKNQTAVPQFRRIQGERGRDLDICEKHLANRERCKGVAGLSRGMVNIIDHYNTTGITLVLDDDFEIFNLKEYLKALQTLPIPNNWDILRFDCWGHTPNNFVPILSEFGGYNRTAGSEYQYQSTVRVPGIFETRLQKDSKCTDKVCWFCGGAYNMIWRGGPSIQKLRALWSQAPYGDIDCRLTIPSNNPYNIHSYCINMESKIGGFNHPEGEVSNIPKIAAP